MKLKNLILLVVVSILVIAPKNSKAVGYGDTSLTDIFAIDGTVRESTNQLWQNYGDDTWTNGWTQLHIEWDSVMFVNVTMDDLDPAVTNWIGSMAQTPTITTNFTGYASGGIYSNANNFVIFVKARGTASLGILGGNTEMDAVTSPYPFSSTTAVTNDWFSQTSILALSQSPKFSLQAEVPPHWLFTFTNAAVPVGNSITLAPKWQFTSQP